MVIVTLFINSPIENAKKAVDNSNIAKYIEQIEQIRSKLLLLSENHELPNLMQMKEALEKEKWVTQTEMIMDEGIEKLKVVSKEGYIFYITEESVEYKGKGEVIDTSALKRDDVLELVVQDRTENGQYVRITSKAENYYIIKYKIGEEENNWKEIKSGERGEVPYGKIIYSKLFYGSSSGVEFKLKIGEFNPSIVAKSTDTSNMKRKTDMVFANLFDITWGSEGAGSIKYEVTGNILFNNADYNNTEIENTKELELGTYNVKCTIESPNGYTTNAQKQVKITTLASTIVTNISNSIENANAIYSEYDIAYFRDLVNNKNYNINAKVMNDIDMKDVCIDSWLPKGYAKNDFSIVNTTVQYLSYYNGIFDGNKNIISNFFINDDNSDITLGLFGIIDKGIIKNCIFSNVSIIGNSNVGTIAGYINNAKILNCKVSGNLKGKHNIGGVVGIANNNSIIYSCKNEVNIVANSGTNFGGISSALKGNSQITYCYNIGNITNEGESSGNIGGITGRIEDGGKIEYSYNNGKIFGNLSQVGGVCGSSYLPNRNIYITNCYNLEDITGNSETTDCIGGILSHYNGSSESSRLIINNVYNKGNISTGNNVGGIIGSAIYINLEGEILNFGSVYNSKNYIGAITGKSEFLVNNFTKRAYGGNCSSSLKANGNGNTNSYDENLVMPSVYNVVNELGTDEFIIKDNENMPILKNIEY